jgi:dihydroorotate dehydrogenase subfamily 2
MRPIPAIIHAAYTKVLKPVLFSFDPEDVHDVFTVTGSILGRFSLTRGLTAAVFKYSDGRLEQDILGIHFRNPIGLAAGFDKNAVLLDIMPSVGFGFTEVGSVTGEPCQGNPRPRLWRLKKSRSIGVWYGLKNDGCEIIAKRLAGRKFKMPFGVSVAMTNCAENADLACGVGDYAKSFKTFATGPGDYLTINISCPNAFGGQPFTDAQRLEALLTKLDAIPTKKPVFMKMSPDLSEAEIDAILEVTARHRVHGFVCTNLTKQPGNPKLFEAWPPHGGLSGKVVSDLSDKMISQLYRKTNGKYVIIGCGGVFSAADAYRKMALGASLIQLITGMLFEGPQVIGEINAGLVELMEKKGFANVSQIIGSENKT